jgi:ferredoxin-NADP reductase/predicted pyridoxine 5'-phosphate oxidase superfamily flavin-nucleotide-binding protein
MADVVDRPQAAPAEKSRPIDTPSIWHAGEMALQETVGVRRAMERQGAQVIRDHLIDQHRLFFPLLPSIIIGAVDENGDVWSTMREGPAGFLSVADNKTLEIAATVDVSDPAEAGLSDGCSVGLLGIQLGTRRRNRLNGVVRGRGANGFSVGVRESYGNCPQYIQLRNYSFEPAPASRPSRQESAELSDVHRAMIAAADTFFVASYVDRDGSRHVDVSHRGGKPGFVRVNKDGSLTIPDFAGNLYFNTLGDILVSGRAGLCFPDFESGSLLQITGKAEVLLDSPEIALFQGAERLWRVYPERVVYRAGALALRWTKVEGGESPNSLMTGSWDEVRDQQAASKEASSWRRFRVARRVRESTTVSSFFLEPADGEVLLRHKAGQYLPIRVHIGDQDAPAIRNYTISAAPSDGCYRISVKREGAISSFLHDRCDVGTIIEARAPEGSFGLRPAGKRPSVLVAAGIGITPMIAMLRHRLFERQRTRSAKQTWLFYSSRSVSEQPFDRELHAIATNSTDWLRVVRLLSNTQGAMAARDYELGGRLTAEVIKDALPSLNCDFYLCGPPGFMQDMYDGLRAFGVSDDQLFAEAFGPAAFRRHGTEALPPLPSASTKPVSVVFSKSGTEALWEPESGTLLELAERAGLTPDFSCRSGSCGTCRAMVSQGEVTYENRPGYETRDQEALLCCAFPAERPADDRRPLVIEL